MQPLTATKPKLGFAGIGWIGKSRLMAIKEKQVAEINAAVDPNQAAMYELKRKIKALRNFDSFEAMLEQDIDGILIATPSALHASQALLALNNGKAVFCQKPLGRNEKETDEVVNTARRKNLLLGVDFSYRYTKATKKVKEIIQSGELGSIFGIQLVFHNAYGPDKSWYYNTSLSGGGCLMDLGIHLIDLVFWCLDETEIKHASSTLFHQSRRLKNRQKQAEDYAVAQFSVKDAAVQLACSWNLPAGKDAVIKAVFYGEHGGVTFRNINGSFYNFKAEKLVGTNTETLVEPPDNWSGRAAVAWSRKLAEENAFDPAAASCVDVARALDLIYKNSQ